MYYEVHIKHLKYYFSPLCLFSKIFTWQLNYMLLRVSYFISSFQLYCTQPSFPGWPVETDFSFFSRFVFLLEFLGLPFIQVQIKCVILQAKKAYFPWASPDKILQLFLLHSIQNLYLHTFFFHQMATTSEIQSLKCFYFIFCREGDT